MPDELINNEYGMGISLWKLDAISAQFTMFLVKVAHYHNSLSIVSFFCSLQVAMALNPMSIWDTLALVTLGENCSVTFMMH